MIPHHPGVSALYGLVPVHHLSLIGAKVHPFGHRLTLVEHPQTCVWDVGLSDHQSRWQGESSSVWDPYRSWGVGDEVRGAMDPTLINVERLTVLTVCREKKRIRDNLLIL